MRRGIVRLSVLALLEAGLPADPVSRHVRGIAVSSNGLKLYAATPHGVYTRAL